MFCRATPRAGNKAEASAGQLALGQKTDLRLHLLLRDLYVSDILRTVVVLYSDLKKDG